MARVPASEKTRNELKAMFEGDGPVDCSRLVCQVARLIVEEALESEAADALGRGYYERGSSGRGCRNGYRLGRVKTAESEIAFALPQVSDTAEQIREVIRGRTEELECLAVEMHARGLSVRDIEAAFSRVKRGAACLRRARHPSSASGCGPITRRFLPLRGRDRREAALGAAAGGGTGGLGVTETGHKLLLGLAPGTEEDTASCRDFLRDLKARGLLDPILGATDGAAGLIRTFEEVFPRTLPCA
jgi:putative transposase